MMMMMMNDVVDKSLPSMQHDTAITPVLPSVHTEPHISRRCFLLQPRFHFIVYVNFSRPNKLSGYSNDN